MIPGIDPKIDFVFKRVFGGEEAQSLLPHLINAVRERISTHHVTSVQVLNPFSDKMTLDEKLSILDIKALDESAHWYNVEMQMLAVAAVRQRFLYYWAKLYAAQLQEGDDYRELRPTISICFIDAILFRDRPDDYHTVFKLKSEDGNACLTDDLEIHLFELPKFRKSLPELASALDVWLFFLKNGAVLDADDLPGPLNVLPICVAMEVLKKMSQNTIEREIYEGRLKAQRDQRALTSELNRMESEAKRWHERYDQIVREHDRAARELDTVARERDTAARERDTVVRERDTVVRERDTAARERDTAARERDTAARERDEAKMLVVRQIQMCERLLIRPVSDSSAMMSNSLDELRKMAERLENELTKGTGQE